jgi:hypothetical protein
MYQLLVDQVMQTITQFNPQNLANTIWGWSKMESMHPGMENLHRLEEVNSQ